MSIDSIHKAPIFEAFSIKCGCPICRIYDRYEKNAINTLMLEGVMDYGIRTLTNEQGFCDKHLEQICFGKDSLSSALMFYTYLEKHLGNVKGAKGASGLKKAYQGIVDGCYICKTVDKLMAECEQFVSQLYREQEFKALFKQQEFFCAKHTLALLESAKLPKKLLDEYLADIKNINLKYGKKTMDKLESYSTSFDYRNASKSVADTKDCNQDVFKYVK